MDTETAQAQELKGYCTRVLAAKEGGCTFYLLEGLNLPQGCTPCSVDALLCPSQRDGYPSRLYFAERIQCRFERNWNTLGVLILGRQWNAFSWKVDPAGLSLVRLLNAHLQGFTRC